MDVPTSASLGAMGPLLRKLDSLVATEDTFRGEVNNEIKLLTEDVKKINTSLVDLSDAEDPPLTAKCWMKEVRELSYDMEDYYDQIMHSGAGADAKTGTVGKSGLLKISRLQKTKVKRRSQMAIMISEFRARVQDARERRERYGLESITLKHRFVSYGHRLPTLHAEPAHADHLIDHGPMDELIKSISSDKEKQLKVVSIVGHAGVGKTTLAKRLYQKLGGQFECRAFIRVSLNPDIRRLLTSTFLQIQRQQPCVHWDAQDLTNNIANHLQNKRYFIIIDDLWAASMWDIISRAFPEGNCCSRIITTTQIEDVAFACCSYRSEHIFKLRAFDDDQSRKLFFSRIFGSEFNCPQEFKEVSYGIIQKCGGLPLAIINVASLLACEPKLVMEKWMHIQHSLCSSSRTNPFDLPGQQNEVPMESPEKETKYFRPIFSREGNEILKVTSKQDDFRHKNTSQKSELLARSLITNPTSEGMKEVLNLIYNNLPQYLKTCLLYLNMYPEDYTIQKDDLVKQWMAEAFLSAEEQDTEEVAGGYFDELIGRGMIQPVDTNYNDEVLSCTVHHMVLNFITYKSMEENFITVLDSIQTIQGLPDKVRRLSIQFGSAKCAKIPASFRMSQVRSLTFFGLFTCIPSIVDYRLLRVLILQIWPDQDETSFDLSRICELFRLRYLKIACNMTVKLPARMRGLLYLETLEVDARVAAVPSDIVHLQSLLNLRLPRGNDLPDGIGHVTSLRRLGYFNLSNKYTDNVVNLGNLTNLRDLHLTCSTESSDRLQVNMQLLGSVLGKCINLKSLILDAGASSTTISCDGLSSVSPPLALLQRLELLPRICVFSNIPKWVGELGKLCILKIAVRKLSRKDIGILKGLPALTALSLYVHTVPVERIVFDKPGFSVLKYFKFRCSVPWLKFEADAMPNLRKLKLRFNALSADQHGTAAISIEHLSGLREISAKIGGAKADAESTLMTVISNHPSNPRIKMQLVDCIFCGDESRSMGTKEKEYMTIEEQDETLEEDTHECYTTQGEDSGEDENKQADSSRVGGEQHDELYRITSATEDTDASGIYSLAAQEQGPWTVEEDQISINYITELGKGSWTELKKDESKPAIVEDAPVSSSLDTPFERYHKQRKVMATVSASQGAMGSLLGKLGDLLADKYMLLKEAKGEIMFLKDELENMHAFIRKMSDVEEPDKQEKCWVKDVRELSYDIEDSVDEFMLRVERESNSKPHGFKGFIDRSINLLTTIHTRHQIAREFQGLKSRVMEVSERRTRYKVDDTVSKPNNTPIDPRMLALYAETASLVGIDEPREDLIRLMMDEEGGPSQQLKVISIVGFGGLGKTTLANEIYRKLKGQFQSWSFVSVSQKPNVRKILRNILSQVGYVAPKETNMEIWDVDELISKLQEFLMDKRYIMVIDDIWDANAWNIIRCALPENKNGSRVITTTRIETVATVCCSNHYGHVYKMRPLSNEESRRLFFLRIFGSEGASPPYLEEVSTEILKRCGGLPLAVITISSLLASQQNKIKEHWEHVRNSLGSNLEVNPILDGMRQILSLSYIHLPDYLKTCMLYLGIYPEDYTIHKYDLVRQWVAQGFISKAPGRDPEGVAEGYFNELVNRSIIQPVDTDPNDDVLSCRVHDMMLDLIVHKCREENFITAIDDIQDIAGLHDKVRRLSLYLDGVIDGTALGTVQLSQVRALARFGTSTYIPPLLKFKHLRVLTLEFQSGLQGINDLTGMCYLFQLQYLKIRASNKIVLPSEIRGLQQLETLEIERRGYWDSSMAEVPLDVVHLRRLLHLHLIVHGWIRLPDGIGNMKSLRTLRKFDLYMNSTEAARGIGDLTNLRDLEIRFHVVHWELDGIARRFLDVLRSSLEKLCNLKYLNMHSDRPDVLCDELSWLSARPRLLQRLHMEFLISRVPKWISELHILSDLTLYVKEVREDDVGILAQLPSLTRLKLYIYGTPKENVVICETGFPVLKQFTIICNRITYVTFEAGAMPRLQRLELKFNAQGWDKYGVAPAGIEHLSGLKEIFAAIGSTGDEESDGRAAESALRNVIDVHPGRPTANIERDDGFFLFNNEDNM